MRIPRLSELQHDALVEIFNVGVGQAANSMSQIVGDAITLAVPKVDLISGKNQAEAIGAIIHNPRICAVSQNFTGGMEAKAFLIFPEGKTREIVRRMMGELVSAEDLSEMEQEALSEIGNIILNSCFSSMSDLLQVEFQSSLPTYHLGSIGEVLSVQENNDDNLLLLLHIDFSMPSDQINGYLVFLLTLPSFTVLIKQIDKFLSDIHGL
jgi:chemotaxis protein CheC